MKRTFPIIMLFPMLLIAADLYAEKRADEDIQVTISHYTGSSNCFKIVTSDDVTIITDPYDMTEDVAPDIVTISHGHGDHADPSHLEGTDYTLLAKPGEYEVKGIPIVGVAGQHDQGDWRVTNTIFVFDFGGMRVAEFASQGQIPTAEMYEQIGDVDVLFIQVFDDSVASKLSLEEALEVINTLQPKIIIPEHGDTSLNLDLAEALEVEYEITDGEVIIGVKDLEEDVTPRVIEMR